MYTKLLLTFAGGSAFGALVTFAIMREIDKQEKELQEIEEEVKKIEESDDPMVQGMRKGINSTLDVKSLDKKEKKAYHKIANDYEKPSLEELQEGVPVEEETINDAYKEEDENEEIKAREFVDDGVERELAAEDFDVHPYIPYTISYEDYETAYPQYDKITLTYYHLDNTLTDERDEIIPEADEILGVYALDDFGKFSKDDNIVHVRNHKLGADYEVCKVDESYSETVLGIEN